MIADDIFRLSLSEIRFHKIQSMLIVASVAVGVFAVFALNSVGSGLKEQFTKYTDMMGSDIALMSPGSFTTFGSTLSDQDIRIAKTIPSIVRVCPFMMNVETIEGNSYGVRATEPECYQYMEDRGIYQLAKGSFGAVAGYSMADQLKLDINSVVKIAGKKFRVTGILKQVGSQDDDTGFYIYIRDMQNLYGKNQYPMAFVQFVGDPSDLEQAVKNKFRSRDIQVVSYQQLIGQVVGLLDTLDIALTGVAFISLLVGGITIANTVYATIRRRTREIGMLKAIGAKDDEVMWVFLSETLMLSTFGGVVGILVGYSVASLIAQALSGFLLFSPSLSPTIVFGSLLVAVLIGPVSALVPALHAAKLPPTEALRYE